MSINKYVKMILIGAVCMTAFSGCASHQYKDKNYYDRANKASEKALDKLDRE